MGLSEAQRGSGLSFLPIQRQLGQRPEMMKGECRERWGDQAKQTCLSLKRQIAGRWVKRAKDSR